VRLIDADDVIERLNMICDAGGCLLPVTKAVRSFCKGLINRQPTIEVEPVTWYTAAENQPDSVGDDVLIVDHDGKYHVAYYCSKGNWSDTNTGNPIEVVKWRYLRRDNDETN
jgi:hypothetical protein